MVRHGCHGDGVAETVSVSRVGFAIDRVFICLVLGFGLFKAVVDQVYSSAMFTARSSFPIINGVEFAIATSFSILLACVLVMVVSWRRPSTTLRAAGIACTAFLLVTASASALGVFSAWPLPLAGIAFSVVYGAAAVVSNAAWLLPIAHLPARQCLAALACSYMLAKVVSEIVAALAVAWALPLILLAGLGSIVLFCTRWTHEAYCVSGACAGVARPPLAAARTVAVDLADPIAVFAVLNMVLGLIMAFQVMGDQAVEGSSFLKAVASVAANLLLLGIAVFAKGMPNIRRAFGLLFPVVALLLIALPFMDHVYGALFGVLLMFLQGIVSTMVLFMLLEVAKRMGTPVIAMVAAISFVSRVFVLAGVLVGRLLGFDTRLDDTVRMLIVVVVALYVLALALVWLLRGRTGGRAVEPYAGAELSTFDEFDGACKGEGEPASLEKPPLEEESSDMLVEHARKLASGYHLTAREAEVALLLARGRSAAYIADELGISPHTVRGYIKDAYAKLGVHAKQGLIDLYSAGE